jgi:uncharacterized protein GlcG (DUF336 family)
MKHGTCSRPHASAAFAPVRRVALLVALASTAGAAAAQATKLTQPLTTLQTGAALTAAQAAFDRCRKDGYTVAVAVVDRSGNALAVLRDPLAGAHTVPTAIGKASTAVSFRIDTSELARETQAGRPQSGIRAMPGVVAVGGGLPVQAKGALLGGIGVSGAPGGDTDEVCAKAGIAAVADAIELE